MNEKMLQDYLSSVWSSDFGAEFPPVEESLTGGDDDPVNHPSHYNNGEVECIDAIKAALGEVGFRSYCRGNAIKYIWRCEHKGKRVEDLQKAAFYINEITEGRNNV